MHKIQWIHQFDLILFDFDGLLVSTEELHFAAYQQMCRRRGSTLKWNFFQFCHVAHLSSTGLRDRIYAEFPELYAQEPRWEVLYKEKKEAYQRQLQEGKVELLPGVAEVLKALQDAGIKRCVVTNSTREQVESIKQCLPLLQSIPEWITREQYDLPKPAPDGYQKAIGLLAKEGDRMIGFEDSFRGLRSLEAAGCPGVLICSPHHPQLDGVRDQGIVCFGSFSEIPDQFIFNVD